MKELKELPAGWRCSTIGEVIANAQSGFACGVRDEEGIIQLRMNNVSTNGGFVWEEFIRVPCDDEFLVRYKLLPGDIVFNNTNSTELVGKSALFQRLDEDVVYSNHFTRLRVKPDKCDPAYFSYWLNYLWKSRVFENICNRWIGQSAVKPEKLFSLKIPLPPLPEQRRISALLTEQLAAVEQVRKASEARLAAARALPAAYLREVFESEEVNKWPIFKLGDLITLRHEVIHPKDNPSGSAIFVGLEHIVPGIGERIGCDYIMKENLTGRKPQFYKNDIVYGYLRPYLNKVWIADFDGLCSVDQYVYTVRSNIADNQFVAWYLRSPVYLERAPIGTTPGQLPRIRVEEVAATEINLPPLHVQKEIATDISRRI